MKRLDSASRILCSLAALTFGLPGFGEPRSRLQRVEDLRRALKGQRYDEAATYLVANPRVWYEIREGNGLPWRLRAGRWKAWDQHFNGVSELQGSLEVEGNRVWADFFETNDYFRLLDRGGGSFRQTWFFDEAGKIEGYLISAVPGAPEAAKGRGEEFLVWVGIHASEELEYLRPGGKIDPTGDRAPRTRALLERWRRAIGEPLGPDG